MAAKGSSRQRMESRPLDLALIPVSGTLATRCVSLSPFGRPRQASTRPAYRGWRHKMGDACLLATFCPPITSGLVTRLRVRAITWWWTQVDQQFFRTRICGNGWTSKGHLLQSGQLVAPRFDPWSFLNWLHERAELRRVSRCCCIVRRVWMQWKHQPRCRCSRSR